MNKEGDLLPPASAAPSQQVPEVIEYWFEELGIATAVDLIHNLLT